MSVTAWIILIIIFSFASFFMASALCSAGRDDDKAKAYKRGLQDGMARKLYTEGKGS
jgi:hypothetical protein